jgi:hypothetical protein
LRAAAQALLRDALDGERPSLGPWLVVASGRSAGRRMPIAGEEVLGRSAAASLRLVDPHVSRRHARITSAGGEVALEDLGSRSGTRRNGRRLRRGVHRLAPGDEIDAGTTRLRLVGSLDAGLEAGGALPDGSAPPGAPAPGPGLPPEPRARTRRRRLAGVPAAAALLLAACAVSLALAALA